MGTNNQQDCKRTHLASSKPFTSSFRTGREMQQTSHNTTLKALGVDKTKP